MIIDVKKYLVMGVKEEIDLFFAKAQESGIAEFISPHASKPQEFPIEIVRLLQAMKILRKLPVKHRAEVNLDLLSCDELAGQIIDLKAEIERLSEEKRLLEIESVRVAPFGDFSTDDVDFIEHQGKRSIQFFCRKTSIPHEDSLDEGMVYIGSDYDLDYFMSIHPSAVVSSDKIEMRIDRPWGELQTHLQFVKESLHQLEAELKGYAGYIELFHEILLERLNAHHLAAVKQDLSFPLGNTLFCIEAWVPECKLEILHQIVDTMAIHCEQIAIGENEKVPTYIENQGVARIGEDLVKIYDVPDTSDKDPSRFVFWCFVIFFSMIVNDGGYGFLYLGLCIYAKMKYRQLNSAIKRLLNLATILSVGCIVWGVLSASFFGLELNPKGWLSRLSVVNSIVYTKAQYHMGVKDDVYHAWVDKFPQLSFAKTGEEFATGAVIEKGGHLTYPIIDTFSDNIFLEFALVLGMVHICLSLLRYCGRHVAALGWVVFIAGGYLYFPSLLDGTSFINIFGIMDKAQATAVGLQAIYTGIIAAVALALIQKRFKGISEISTLISVFADILSYLRLYALGLSTAIMAETFNDLGQEVGLFLGALVIIAGHAITIAMGLMTGVIHGLRLNFIEWYHYSFHGGGRLFAPLMCFKKKSEEE